MELMEAMQRRHAVRQFTDRPLPPEVTAALREEIDACNAEGGLHIQLVAGEPEAFQGIMAHYGKFRGVQNYIALIGPRGADRKLGYYGERLVLRATQLGLDSCWVALTFRKGKCRCEVGPGEKLVCVVALGYGENHGVPHKSKPFGEVARAAGEVPAWFRSGVEAALLAPTATNQQKFLLTLEGNTVQAKATGGFYSQVDLGIVQYHFEIGAGREHFTWA